MFFNRNGSGGVEWLLVGLGNPGSKYESTRHNMGWLALDSLMEKEKFALNKLRFKAWTGMLDYKGHKILVMKPQTYMNLSGESVGEAARFYKVPADHVLVISDDVSLPVGKLRIRKSGSAGGHNGIKNKSRPAIRKRPRHKPAPASADATATGRQNREIRPGSEKP